MVQRFETLYGSACALLGEVLDVPPCGEPFTTAAAALQTLQKALDRAFLEVRDGRKAWNSARTRGFWPKRLAFGRRMDKIWHEYGMNL